MDKLEAMQTFVAIVDGGSLTQAAKTLGKAQSTVVRTLAVLEEELGVRLLQRSTRRMSLTNEGKSYLERCRQILGDVQEAEAIVRKEISELRGKLRVTAPVCFGQLHVAPVVNQFIRDFPEVQVELVLLDRVVDLVSEGFDLGVRIASLDDSSLIASKVGQVRTLVVASPDLLARVGEPQAPEDLRALPCVTLLRPGPGALWSFVKEGEKQVIQVPSAMSSNLVQTALSACEAGVGFARLLSYQVQEALDMRRVKQVLTAFEVPPTSVNVVYAHARLISVRQRALVKRLQLRLRESLRVSQE